MTISLQNRFLIPTIAFLIISTAAVTWISADQTRASLKTAILQQISHQNKSTAAMIRQWIRSQETFLTHLSHQHLFASALQEGGIGKASRRMVSAELGTIQSDYPFYTNISLADQTGRIVSSSNPDQWVGQNAASRSFFTRAMAGHISVSHFLHSADTGDDEQRNNSRRHEFVVSVPVRTDGDDKAQGVIFATVPYAHIFTGFLKHVDNGLGGSAYIIDGTGEKRICRDCGKNGRDGVAPELAAAVRRHASGELTHSMGKKDFLSVFQRIGESGWFTVISVSTDQLYKPVNRIFRQSFWVSAIIILAAILFTLLNVKRTVRRIFRIVHGLNENAGQVFSASNEVATSSQALAEGASRQASAIEESSTALRETASITRRNADNSRIANGSMDEVRQVVAQANHFMTDITASMEDISAASRKSSNIIQTIDEIAFQTNLLSLNAAVEAARAGEAGAGFAVVAEEVRRLARRSADAAQNTSGLLEQTLSKVVEGNLLVAQTNDIFEQVGESVERTNTLVREITEASEEQAHRIEQVTAAVSEMEKVTQHNAASAEESASASEEMSAQAQQMKQFVGNLMDILSGAKGGAGALGSSIKRWKGE